MQSATQASSDLKAYLSILRIIERDKMNKKVTKTANSFALRGWLAKLKCAEQFTIDGSRLFCQPCKLAYSFGMKSQLEQHLKTQVHIKNLARFKDRPSRQMLLNEATVTPSPFFQDLCETFLAAGIPWTKLNHPKMREFFEKHTERIIPDESTLRKNYLPRVFSKTLDDLRADIGNLPIWLQVDETKDPTGRCILNVIVGGLSMETAQYPHLLVSKEIPGDAQNSHSVTRFVLDALQVLWPGAGQDKIESKFYLLLTDAAPYMIKAGRNLKTTYPALFHITCLSHGLHRVAEDIRAHYPNINAMIGAVKAVFKKAPMRVKLYKQNYPDLPLPPDVVVTRWGKWLEAALFYCENHDKVLQVIQKLDAKDAQVIAVAKTALEKKELKSELAYIASNFGFIVGVLNDLQKCGRNIVSVVEQISVVETKLKAVKGKVGAGVYNKFKNVLEKNPNFSDVQIVAQILGGDSSCVSVLDANRIAHFKFAPLVTAEVERSFSMEKNLLSDRRRSLTSENLEMTVVCHYNLCKPVMNIS